MLTMKRHSFTGPMEATRYFVSTGVIGLTALMLPMSVGAAQGSAGFQVTLKIVAPPSAPKVSQHVVSATSPGYPPHPMLKDKVVTEGTPGSKLIVLTTEF